MKNPAPYVRTALRTLLHETITYDSVQVPCYEGQGEIATYQILLADQSGLPRDDKHSFNTEFSQTIEVVSEQETNMRKHVDLIGAEVMNILRPSAISQALTGNSDFQIMRVRRDGQNYLTEESGEGSFINRLILRYTFLIVEH